VSAPDLTASVTFHPSRWRAWVAWAHLIVVAIGVALLIGFNWYRGPIVLAWLGLLLFPTLMLFTLRRVRVVPGVRLERWRPFRRPLAVPGGSGTDILYYANVVGTRYPIRPLGTPIGVVDNRWAVVRREGKVVMRFSMRIWSIQTLDRIALLLGVKFTHVSTGIDPWTVAKRHPDYYWKLEQRPTLYLWLFCLALVAMALWILASLTVPFILSQIWGTA
jgi:hypothetical protein